MIRNHACSISIACQSALGSRRGRFGRWGGNAQFLAAMKSLAHRGMSALFFVRVPMHLVVSLAHAEQTRTARLHVHYSVITDLGIRYPRDRSCCYPPCTFHSPTASHAFLQYPSRSYFGHSILPCRCLFASSVSRTHTHPAEACSSYASYLSSRRYIHIPDCLDLVLIHSTLPLDFHLSAIDTTTRPTCFTINLPQPPCACESSRSTQSAAASTTSTALTPVPHMVNTGYQTKSSKSDTHVQHI